MNGLMKFVTVILACGFLASPSVAQQLSADEQLENRVRVQTAIALARIAEADGDADAMLVAARVLASVDTAAKLGDDEDLYSVERLANAAREMGADADKVDELLALESDEAERSYCYWEFKCNTFDCAWVYVC